MLVLSRRINERVLIPGLDVSIQVVAVRPGVVRIGFEGPDNLCIFREEIFDPEAWKTDPRRREQDIKEMMGRLLHQLRNPVNTAKIGVSLLKQQFQRGLFEDMGDTISRVEKEILRLQSLVENRNKPTDAPAEVSGEEKAMKALLVEDDANEAHLLAGLLRMSGIEVSTATDGEHALEYLRTNRRPDVVLMDMMMPRCDGLTAVRMLRRDPDLRDLTIFAVTGFSPESLNIKSDAGLIDRWFHKPLNPEELVEEIRTASHQLKIVSA